MFTIAYNKIFINKDSTLEALDLVKVTIDKTSKLDEQINKLKEEIKEMEGEFRILVKANTTTAQDQNIWKKKYAELEEKYQSKQEEVKKLYDEKDAIAFKLNKIDAFKEMIKKGEPLVAYDERIFNFMIDKAIVHKDKSITFEFLSDQKIDVKVEE